MEDLDYALVPEAAWELLHGWYGLSQGSRPIERLQLSISLSSIPSLYCLFLPDMLLSTVPM